MTVKPLPFQVVGNGENDKSQTVSNMKIHVSIMSQCPINDHAMSVGNLIVDNS